MLTQLTIIACATLVGSIAGFFNANLLAFDPHRLRDARNGAGYGALYSAVALGIWCCFTELFQTDPNWIPSILIGAGCFIGSAWGFLSAPIFSLSANRPRDAMYGAWYGLQGGFATACLYGLIWVN